ncbi:MAG: hypothetical protein ACK4OE_14325 [Acidovorax sp.]|uniref:hypothetical protein n=1 Tax=Acidovorax sp. TaxID=1872122 RepID=UPI00391D2827
MTCIEIFTKTIEILAASLATLAAAYFGAKYAFSLQNEKEKRTSDASDVKAANSAIFELARTYNKFLAVKNQFIDEHRNKAERHLMIMPVVGMSWEPPKFNYDTISFLFRSSDPNLLGTLSLVEQEIASTLDVIHQRSAMHVDVLQPAVEKLSQRVGSQVSMTQIENELGQRLAATLKMSTDFMIQGVDNVLAGCIEHMNKIKAETDKIYPGHVVINLLPPKNHTQADTPAA